MGVPVAPNHNCPVALEDVIGTLIVGRLHSVVPLANPGCGSSIAFLPRFQRGHQLQATRPEAKERTSFLVDEKLQRPNITKAIF